MCCPFRHAAMSAACRWVWPYITRPDQWTTDNTLHSKLQDFSSTMGRFLIRNRPRCISWDAAAEEDATRTSRAALRPGGGGGDEGTAAVVKMSAGVDVVSVSCRGSVVTPGSVSFKPPSNACYVWPRVASSVLPVSPCSSCESKNVTHRRHPPSPVWLRLPSRSCTVTTKSCSARTLSAHASR